MACERRAILPATDEKSIMSRKVICEFLMMMERKIDVAVVVVGGSGGRPGKSIFIVSLCQFLCRLMINTRALHNSASGSD